MTPRNNETPGGFLARRSIMRQGTIGATSLARGLTINRGGGTSENGTPRSVQFERKESAGS